MNLRKSLKTLKLLVSGWVARTKANYMHHILHKQIYAGLFEIIKDKKEIFSSQNKISNFNNIIANYSVFQANIEKIDSLFIDQKESIQLADRQGISIVAV